MTREPIAFAPFQTPTKIAVLGAGSWGTALAALLAANGHSPYLWARNPELANALRADGENRRYLPGIPLPNTIFPTADLCEALSDAPVVLFAVPSGAMRQTAADAYPLLHPGALLISASKGLEDTTGLRMSQILSQTIPCSQSRTVALSGPNLAVEVARGIPTASVAAASNLEAARAVQRLFLEQPTPVFRVYTGTDVIGVELAGAIKNVIAIAAGVCDGMGYGDNAKAAIMTRGLAEAVRLGISQGAQMQTFLGLSGVGDLIATGASRLSRNYRVGFALGEGRSLPDILREIGQVAEGVPTARALFVLAQGHQVDMPLCASLNAVLFEGRTARDLIGELLVRPPKDESSGL